MERHSIVSLKAHSFTDLHYKQTRNTGNAGLNVQEKGRAIPLGCPCQRQLNLLHPPVTIMPSEPPCSPRERFPRANGQDEESGDKWIENDSN